MKQAAGLASRAVKASVCRFFVTVVFVSTIVLNEMQNVSGQSRGVTWLIGSPGTSCEYTCSSLSSSSQCVFTELTHLINNRVATQQAFIAAGITPTRLKDNCVIGSVCADWGNPFIHGVDTSTCSIGNAVAPCNAEPVDGQHRRLCPCGTPSPFGVMATAPGLYAGGPYRVIAGRIHSFTTAMNTSASFLDGLFVGLSSASNVRFFVEPRTKRPSFLYIDPRTAQIQAYHDSNSVGSSFRLEIFANDTVLATSGTGLDHIVSVYNLSYTVMAPPLSLSIAAPFTFVDPMSGTTILQQALPRILDVGRVRRFLAPSARTSNPTPTATLFTSSSGAVGNITFSLDLVRGTQIPPVGDVSIDPLTGSIFLEPSLEYTVTYELLAQDRSGSRPLRVLTWTFSTRISDIDNAANGPNGRGCGLGIPVDDVEFDSRFVCNCSGVPFIGSNCAIPTSGPISSPPPRLIIQGARQVAPNRSSIPFMFYNRTTWAQGKTYAVAPLQFDKAYIESDVNNHTDVAFSLSWNAAVPPLGFFIDGLSAEMLIQIPRHSQVLTAQVMAVATRVDAVPAIIANLTFNISFADTDVPANGPQGRDCHSSDERFDSIEFDGIFTCICTNTSTANFTGPNCDPYTVAASLSESDDSAKTYLPFVIAIVCTLVGVVAVLLWRFHRQMDKRRRPHSFETEMHQLQECGLLSARDASMKHDPCELPRKDITLGRQLGQGNFGIVHQAVLKGRTTNSAFAKTMNVDVAVKILQETDSANAKTDFFREAAITWLFDHKNVVKMFGVVTSGSPYMLVLELCTNGELKNYLQGDAVELDLQRQYAFLQDITAGMIHLGQLGFVHRDLASRNVLLDHEFVAKICDFGLGRDTDGDYYSSSKGSNTCLPLRWSDPDVLLTSKFSSMTDVWSFGITAIEIFTHAATPYATWSNSLVVERVSEGYRIPRPENCPEWLYNEVIFPCWLPQQGNPKRPSFTELKKRLNNLSENVKIRMQSEIWDALEMDHESEAGVVGTKNETVHYYESSSRVSETPSMLYKTIDDATSSSSMYETRNEAQYVVGAHKPDTILYLDVDAVSITASDEQ